MATDIESYPVLLPGYAGDEQEQATDHHGRKAPCVRYRFTTGPDQPEHGEVNPSWGNMTYCRGY